MKNRAISKYLSRLGLYTVIFAAAVIFLGLLTVAVAYPIASNILHGTIRNIAAGIYDFLYSNAVEIVIVCYIIGIIVITLCTVFGQGKLLLLAEKALSDENSVVYGKQCPEELRSFADSLKAFRAEAAANEQARKIAEQQKNDLIVYLAHDLKTPLTSVIGYLSLLDEAPDIPTEQRAKYIGITLEKAYRLEQLINEFFDITRLNLQNISAQKTTINLSVMLMQITEEFYPMVQEKGMEFVQNISPEIKLRADADKLARALDNLFRNAVNYGYDNTEITVTAACDGENAVVTVANKGDEIPPEKLERVFDKFCRLDNARQSKTGGAGLGLAITKQIVELHGGSVTAACTGNDVSFTVTLPIEAAPAADIVRKS